MVVSEHELTELKQRMQLAITAGAKDVLVDPILVLGVVQELAEHKTAIADAIDGLYAAPIEDATPAWDAVEEVIEDLEGV